MSNATTGGTITFTITNGGASDIELNALHFDAYAFRPKAARTYELSVVAGSDLTPGVVYTSGALEITHMGGTYNNFAHDDIDHDLTGLADHTLGAGESADFLLAFSGGIGAGSGGHDLWVDNVAVTHLSSGNAYPDSDGNGLPDWWEILYLGSTGQVAGVDSDGDGHSNSDELIAGTDPGDIDSSFELRVSDEAPGSAYTVRWDSHSGHAFWVFKQTDLLGATWSPVSGTLHGTGGEMTFTDSVPPPPSNMFYRIQVSQP